MQTPLLLLALLLSQAPPPPSPSPSANPKTEIVAPETAVVPGKQVRLSIKPLSPLDNLVSVAYTWVISPAVSDDMDLWPDHTHISFGSGVQAGNFHIVVVSSFVFQDAEKKISQIQTETELDVAVSEPPPLPDPTPTPTPTPAPVVLPDGKYKFASYMYNLCNKMPATECTALADALASIAKTAREGGYQTKAQVVAAMRDKNTLALGSSLNNWKPLLDHLAATANTMKAVIVTPQDCGIMCDELATGLYTIAGRRAR